ncbi:MAG: hypothetical protein IK114_03275 [Fibrobacter sp.]|nr:hypothetical protein [Fibrobacter sp.]
MKKITTFLGCVGVVCLFWGCSSDSNLLSPGNTLADDEPAISSEAETPTSSGSTSKNSSSSAKTDKKNPTSSSAATAKPDTIRKELLVKDTLKIETPNYRNNPIFCWDENSESCKAAIEAAATIQSSSSITIDIGGEGGGTQIDNSIPPVVNGMQMTDMRDTQTYKLVEVGGKLWMAQDINIALPNTQCYDESDAKCASNGRLYTFTTAQSACPAGWKLPSREEAQAALDDESYPWSYSGRCKDGECSFMGDMGFHWTSATPQSGDKKFDENQGDSYTVIIVEKAPDYGDKDDVKKFFQVDSKTKRFSVRCVKE